jgi:LacI family repressor for deo operon, udp, cdd, tsx, nupC, and nupG
MATLEDVAKKAGVSTATVSKVLSNTPYFTEATRIKVMQAVDEIGYMPHLAARALSSGKTNIIAVVFPYVFDTIFTDPLVLRMLEGIEAECTPRGYNILLSTPRLSEHGPDQHYQQLLQSRYIEGIIALDNVPITSVIAPAEALNIPAVAIGNYATQKRVQSDDFSGFIQLFDHIVSLGTFTYRYCRRIRKNSIIRFNSVLQGYEKALVGQILISIRFLASMVIFRRSVVQMAPQNC